MPFQKNSCSVVGRLGLRVVLLEATPTEDPALQWNSGLTGYLTITSDSHRTAYRLRKKNSILICMSYALAKKGA